MKKLVLTILLISLATLSQASDSLKLMSYNLRFGELASMKQISDFISSTGSDIVALQECDWDTHRDRAPLQNGVKFVNELAYNTGMFGIYGKTINYCGGYYGIGVLSKYPILSYERILLPDPNNDEQRAILKTEIELPSGQIITFVCAHLEVASAEVRMKQVKFINKVLKGVKTPLVLAGDFNAMIDSREIQELLKTWNNISNDASSYVNPDRQGQIDFIFTKNSKGIDVLNKKTYNESKLSDHFPIQTEIFIK